MFLPRRTRFLAPLAIFGLTCLLGIDVSAGDKKKDDKKKTPPALFEKADSLTAKDEKDTHKRLTQSPRKVYTLLLTKGTVYQFDLASKDFDAVLRLEDAAGKQVAFNDDYKAGSLDSRVLFHPNESGKYKIIVTSLDRRTGKFVLNVNDLPGLKSASIFKTKPIALMAKDGKARHSGGLVETDGLAHDHYFRVFTFSMEAGKTYRIDLKSHDFDAFLFLEDPHGNNLAENDDSGKGTDAQIVHNAAASGIYRIIATTLPTRKTGKFVLDIGPK